MKRTPVVSQPRKFSLDEGMYYKFKSRMQEAGAMEAQLQQMLELVKQKKELAFKDAGLDNTKVYALDDETLTITEQVAQTAVSE